MTAGNRLIVALDYKDKKEALAMARRLRGRVKTVKVGSVLFTAYGPAIIQSLRKLGFEVMLDLKFYDIPNTVELSCRAAAGLGISLLTVHASGGTIMLSAAAQGARERARELGLPRPKVLAVTVLTSIGGTSAAKTRDQVVRLALEAGEAGCHGIVASAQEAAFVRRRLGKKFLIVCPGIRLQDANGADDQRRVATPARALSQGADYLVVGRPITAAADPARAVKNLLKEMEAFSGC